MSTPSRCPSQEIALRTSRLLRVPTIGKSSRNRRPHGDPRDLRLGFAACVKLGTRRRPKSHTCAREFLTETKLLVEHEGAPARRGSSVKTTSLKTPARWADATEKTQVYYWSRYTWSETNFRRICFCIRVDQRLITKQKNPATWLLKRIAKEFKRAVAAHEFQGAWIVLHIGPSASPEIHAHGALLVARSVSSSTIRAALKRAGGSWRPGPAGGVQVRIREMFEPDGAARYAYREHRRVRDYLSARTTPVDRKRPPTIAAATQEIRRGAQRLYTTHRHTVSPRPRLSRPPKHTYTDDPEWGRF